MNSSSKSNSQFTTDPKISKDSQISESDVTTPQSHAADKAGPEATQGTPATPTDSASQPKTSPPPAGADDKADGAPPAAEDAAPTARTIETGDDETAADTNVAAESVTPNEWEFDYWSDDGDWARIPDEPADNPDVTSEEDRKKPDAEPATDPSDPTDARRPDVTDVAQNIISQIEASTEGAKSLKELRRTYGGMFSSLNLGDRIWSIIAIVKTNPPELSAGIESALLGEIIDALTSSKAGCDTAIAELGAFVREASPRRFDAAVQELLQKENPLGLGHLPRGRRQVIIADAKPSAIRTMLNRQDLYRARLEILARNKLSCDFKERAAIDQDVLDELSRLRVERHHVESERWLVALNKPVDPQRTDDQKLAAELEAIEKAIVDRQRLLGERRDPAAGSARPIVRLRGHDLADLGVFDLMPGEQVAVQWQLDRPGEKTERLLARRPHDCDQPDAAPRDRGVLMELRYRAAADDGHRHEMSDLVRVFAGTLAGRATIECRGCGRAALELFLPPGKMHFACRECYKHQMPRH